MNVLGNETMLHPKLRPICHFASNKLVPGVLVLITISLTVASIFTYLFEKPSTSRTSLAGLESTSAESSESLNSPTSDVKVGIQGGHKQA